MSVAAPKTATQVATTGLNAASNANPSAIAPNAPIWPRRETAEIPTIDLTTVA